MDGDRRRVGPNVMMQYPDSQQLFMGNIPHCATQDDLKVNSSSCIANLVFLIHKQLCELSLQVNYTDRAVTACLQS
jgi:hypothetical protein